MPAQDDQFVPISLDLLCMIDQDGRIVQANRGWSDMLGYTIKELYAKPLINLLWQEDCAIVEAQLARLGAGATSVSFECRLRSRDNAYYWFVWYITPDQQSGLSYGIGRDITVQKHTEQMLDYQTHYDVVTGLPNRYLFSDRLEQEVSISHAASSSFALFVIDLDHFKQINDILGHTAGDEVLAFVALRLRSVIGSQAMPARMGGDEFTLIMRNIHDPEEATTWAQRILTVLGQPFSVQEQEIFISASIGISLYPQDGIDGTTLLKNADSAMYRAKSGGRNGVCLFDPAISEATRRRIDMELQIRRAIDLAQFELHYQPLVNFHSGKVVAVESLIRWRHPEAGMIMPSDFITLAEETNLMERLFNWGIVEACRQAAIWQREGRPPIRVAVNISARQFERDDIVDRVDKALRASGLEPSQLELEITESMLMNDPEGSAMRIRRLHALGVKVALDDFGTGYSSLAYLQRFPVERLKIDRSFIWALGSIPDPESSAAALLRAITTMAHSLHLKVVAEGVESIDQHRFLARLGCDEGQGFLYARPTSPDML
ncbi:MAG: EAL domain-containing protein, partial [Oscillochloris sp.]|nr:EAL domain-containing protein [Oscillochloris sp.]